MKKLRWLGILMMVTIFGIAGFQVFWLKQTYDREKKNLDFKTEVAFVTTVHNLEASKLKLSKIFSDSLLPPKRVFINNKVSEPFDFRMDARENIVTTIKVLQDKIKDSLKKEPRKSGMVVSMDRPSYSYKTDSTIYEGEIPRFGAGGKNGEIMLRFLSDVDSLQDTLKVKEIYCLLIRMH